MRDFCIALIVFSCILISAVQGNTKLLIEVTGPNSSTVDIEDFARKAIEYANNTALNITVNDVNECESLTLNTCSEDAECVNTDGSFTCGCNSGFLDENEANPGRNCTDIDECLGDNHGCTGNTTCQNTPGNYTCACENGFSRDGTSCVDLDECATNQHNCSQNAVCSNVVASFTCTCKNGYSGDGYNCIEDKKVSSKPSSTQCGGGNVVCPENSDCVNVGRTVRCNCHQGYRLVLKRLQFRCEEIVTATQQTARTTTPTALTTPTETSTTIATGITLALTTNIPLNVTSFTTTEQTTTSSTPPSTANSEQSVKQSTVAESTSQAPSLITSTSEDFQTTEANEAISIVLNTTLAAPSDSTITEGITGESLGTDSVQVDTTRETSTDDNSASVTTESIETTGTDGSDLPITQTIPSETTEAQAITTESNQATTENQDTLTFTATTTSTGQEITTSEQTTSGQHQNTPEAATPTVQTTIDDTTKMAATTVEALVMSTLELSTGQASVQTSKSSSVTTDSGSETTREFATNHLETTAVPLPPDTVETSVESITANLSNAETTEEVSSTTLGISITESIAIATSDTDTLATTQLPEVDTAPSPTTTSYDTSYTAGVDGAQTASLTSQEVTTTTDEDRETTFSVEVYTPYVPSASSSTYITTEKQDNLEENTENNIINSTSMQNVSSATATAESRSALATSSVVLPTPSSSMTQEEITIMATTQTFTNSTDVTQATSEAMDTDTETTQNDTLAMNTTQSDVGSSSGETVTQSGGVDKSEATSAEASTSVDVVTTAGDIVTTATTDQQTTTTNAVTSATSKPSTVQSEALESQTTAVSTQESTTTTQVASTPSIPTTQATTSESPTTLEATTENLKTSTFTTTQSTVETTTTHAATASMLDTTASNSTAAPNATAEVFISTSTNQIVDITTQTDVGSTTLQHSTKETVEHVTGDGLSTTIGSTSAPTTSEGVVPNESTTTMLVSISEKSTKGAETTTQSKTISSAQVVDPFTTSVVVETKTSSFKTSVETTTGNYTSLPAFNGNFKKYIDDLEAIFENEIEVKLKFDEANTVMEIFEQALESNTTFDEKIADTLFDTIAGFALSATGEDGVIDPAAAARMTAFVTTMLEEIDLPKALYRKDKDTLVVEARDVDKSILPAEIDFKPGDSTDRAISLPNAFIQSSSEDESATLRFAFTEYSDGRLFLDETAKVLIADATYTADDFKNGARIVNTAVIGASIANREITNSSERVTVKLKAILSEPLQTGNGNGTVEIVSFTANPKCVWWDYDTLSWSESGCELTNNAGGAMTCKCNHLTSFAVLMSVEKTIDDPILTYLSFIGSGLSIAGLLWTILTFSIFSSLRKSRSRKILLHFCGALCGVYIAYVFGIAAKLPADQAQCIVSGFFLHFLTLSVMAWMSLEVFDMYFMFVKVMWNHSRKYMLKAGLIAWLTPFVAAIITLGAHLGLPDRDIYPIYEEGTICWLGKVGMLYAFIVPSCILLFTNLILFAIVLYHVTFKRNHSALNRLGKKSSKKVKAGQHIINALALLLLAGPTWIIGYFINIEPVEDGVFRRTLSYVFVLLNAFQGFWIFIVFSVRPAPVRKRWVILVTKGKLSDSTTFSSTSGSRHTTRTFKSPRPSLFPPSQEVCARSDCSSLSSAGGKRVVQTKLSNNSNNSDLSSSKSSTKSSTAPLTAYAGKTTTENLKHPALTAGANKAHEDTEKNNSTDRKQGLGKVPVEKNMGDSVNVDDKGGRNTEMVDNVVASENQYSVGVEVNSVEEDSSNINHSGPVNLPQNIEPYDPPEA